MVANHATSHFFLENLVHILMFVPLLYDLPSMMSDALISVTDLLLSLTEKSVFSF